MIIPAIDLMGGGCVRLFKGDFDQRTNYNISPLAMAMRFAKAGAKWLHVVDLDGAKNADTRQVDLILDIAQNTAMKVQTGGGIRTYADVVRLLDGGVKRVVIGSLAASNAPLVKSWISKLGADKFTLAFDVNIGEDGQPRPALHGWTEASDKTLWDILETYMDSGITSVLVTDIAKDGALAGANISLYQEIISRAPALDLITSGGVGSLSDVKSLKALEPSGIIIGKALYENKFTLEQALSC